jgi:hypothetical protein
MLTGNDGHTMEMKTNFDSSVGEELFPWMTNGVQHHGSVSRNQVYAGWVLQDQMASLSQQLSTTDDAAWKPAFRAKNSNKQIKWIGPSAETVSASDDPWFVSHAYCPVWVTLLRFHTETSNKYTNYNRNNELNGGKTVKITKKSFDFLVYDLATTGSKSVLLCGKLSFTFSFCWCKYYYAVQPHTVQQFKSNATEGGT